MANSGRILVADDEDTFRESVAALLREEGYQCDCVADAHAARELLAVGEYDAVIADVKMPGNARLEFVRDLPRIAEGVPVILMTGYPSLDTALEAMGLRVQAYVVKPLDLQDFLAQVESAMVRRRAHRVMCQVRARLEQWRLEVEGARAPAGAGQQDASPWGAGRLRTETSRRIGEVLSDIEHLEQASAEGEMETQTCRMLSCPRLTLAMALIKETVDTLQRTKKIRKSQELTELRTKAERFLSLVTK